MRHRATSSAIKPSSLIRRDDSIAMLHTAYYNHTHTLTPSRDRVRTHYSGDRGGVFWEQGQGDDDALCMVSSSRNRRWSAKKRIEGPSYARRAHVCDSYVVLYDACARCDKVADRMETYIPIGFAQFGWRRASCGNLSIDTHQRVYTRMCVCFVETIGDAQRENHGIFVEELRAG